MKKLNLNAIPGNFSDSNNNTWIITRVDIDTYSIKKSDIVLVENSQWYLDDIEDENTGEGKIFNYKELDRFETYPGGLKLLYNNNWITLKKITT
jgi:hypothetical protein